MQHALAMIFFDFLQISIQLLFKPDKNFSESSTLHIFLCSYYDYSIMPASQSTLDGSNATAAERLQRRLQAARDALVESGCYLGDSANAFRDNVVWKRVGRGNWLVTKDSTQATDEPQETDGHETVAATEDDDENQPSNNGATLEQATLSAVLLISYDDCWLTPCGNWKGPTTVTKNFQDLKLTFQAGPPSDTFNIFKRDFSTVVDNIKWILNEVAVGDIKSKGFLNPTNMLRFRHVLFEVMFFSG